VKISGAKAYVPQSPWILTGNIRENILFGNPYDSVRYYRTVKACALLKDFELFSSGDLTDIGERGINMSGGQKQRIQIARAVYQDADIYLFDDPFSAVDAHTGSQLFQVSTYFLTFQQCYENDLQVRCKCKVSQPFFYIFFTGFPEV
jgi:ATP-binding cassette subfamily C (CFTR/MRP) protein 1